MRRDNGWMFGFYVIGRHMLSCWLCNWAACIVNRISCVDLDGVFPSCCLCSTESRCCTYPRLPTGAHFWTFCFTVTARIEIAFDAFFKSLLVAMAPFWVVVERSLSLNVVKKVVRAIILSTQSRTVMVAVISWSKAVRGPTLLFGVLVGLIIGVIWMKDLTEKGN